MELVRPISASGTRYGVGVSFPSNALAMAWLDGFV